jgi:hypothetical protein
LLKPSSKSSGSPIFPRTRLRQEAQNDFITRY